MSGCAGLSERPADASRYMGLDCTQLDVLAQGYGSSHTDGMFADATGRERLTPRPRSGVSAVFQDRSTATTDGPRLSADRRSIALARREKNCP